MARIFLLLILSVIIVWCRDIYVERIEACNNLNCDSSSNVTVCGIRNLTTTVQFKLFANECELLKYGCSVEDKDAYGIISIEYCKRSDIELMHKLPTEQNLENNNIECEINCNYIDKAVVCGIRQDGEGYRVKLFDNNCELLKHNCNATFSFIRTDMFICKSTLETPDSLTNNSVDADVYETAGNYKVETSNNIIVVDGSMLGKTTDPNETIDNFFAATHVLDLPIKEVDEEFKTRRMVLKYVGPVKVFRPWITIPKVIKTDYSHTPTLSTCYHKCPTQCPNTYSPVCGVPGILAREPSIMFQNHCYMDVAQCKMYWENKSSTAISSSYIESSFLFCLGDQLNGMYRFLPLIKTLQHMGRLKKKTRFRYRLNNMRFFNNYAYKEPKLMG